MRTIKASEVREGMRVRVERTRANVNTTIEGEVCQVFPSGTDVRYVFENGDTWILAPDHPVTVLAEPEPEWVEGAWYRCRMRSGDVRHLQRTADNGWSTTVDGYTAWVDSDGEITVLGRVLIVDWPGDDVERAIERTYTPGGNWIATENTAAQIIADAIRTQGGAP